MKKIFIILMALILVLTGGCSRQEIHSGNYVSTFNSDIETFDYTLNTNKQNGAILTNINDTLTETISTGRIIPSLAESYSTDGKCQEWIIHIRPDVYWSTSDGKVYGKVTAQDWITSLIHMTEFDSELSKSLEGVIKNYKEYKEGKVGFEEVGIRKSTEYTVHYILEEPNYWFYTMIASDTFYPVNQEFLESQGKGCRLGSPDPENCGYGKDKDSILYSGAYLIDEYKPGEKIVLKKNPNYWDKDYVYINEAVFTYDVNKDSNLSDRNDGTTYALAFNYNTADENTHEAIMNSDFRKAVRAGFDRAGFLKTLTGNNDIGRRMVRNIMSAPYLTDFGSHTFGTLVEENLEDRRYDLVEGNDRYYSIQDCINYLAKVTDILYPVTLNMPVKQETLSAFEAMKNSIENSSDNKILINLIPCDENSHNEMINNGEYDICVFSYDPVSLNPGESVKSLSMISGSHLHYLGLKPLSDISSTGKDISIERELGLAVLDELDDKAARCDPESIEKIDYYAKMDAWLTDNCIVIPISCSKLTDEHSVFKEDTHPWSGFGSIGHKLKRAVIINK